MLFLHARLRSVRRAGSVSLDFAIGQLMELSCGGHLVNDSLSRSSRVLYRIV